MPDRNKDKDVPWAETFEFGPVVPASHTDASDLPIFWGPGQLSTSYPAYTAPSLSQWHLNELLSIPRVVRFIYATKDDYVQDEFKDDGDDPDIPPDGLWVYNNTVYWYWQPRLKAEFRDASATNGLIYPYAIIEPYYDAAQTDLDLGAGGGVYQDTVFPARSTWASIYPNGMVDTPNYRVQVRNRDGSGTPYYTGVMSACPFFEMVVVRRIDWTRRRVDNGFTVFVATIFSTHPPGTPGPGAPRCTYTEYETGTIKSEHPLTDYLDIFGDYGPCEGDTPP